MLEYPFRTTHPKGAKPGPVFRRYRANTASDEGAINMKRRYSLTGLLLVSFLFAALAGGCGAGVTAAIIGGATIDFGGDDKDELIPFDTRPKAAVEPFSTTESGDIQVYFTLRDPEGDPVNVAVDFSLDSGITWQAATPGNGSASLIGLATSSAGTQHLFIWDSLADLGPKNVPNVRIRITPATASPGGAATSNAFTAANNEAPVVEFTGTPSGHREGVVIPYRLTDSNSDPVDIIVEYQSGNSGYLTADKTAISEGTAGLASSQAGTDHTFIWDIAAQLGIANYDNLSIRITPGDAFDNGSPVETPPFSISLNNAPSASISTAPLAQRSGVRIIYNLFDDDRDSVDIIILYSFDNFTFLPLLEAAGQGSEGNSGLLGAPGGVSHVYVWDYAGQFGLVNAPQVWLRITPLDPYAGGSEYNYGPFAVNVNTAPTASAVQPAVPQSGPIPIRYALMDPESDTAGIDVEYSTDGGATWQSATEFEHGATEGKDGLATGPAGVSHAFIWDSAHDIGEADFSQVRVRIVPGDSETGAAFELSPISVQNHYRFSRPSSVGLGAALSTKVEIAIGDVSGDGRPDIVTTHTGETGLRVVRQSGMMNWTAPGVYGGTNSFILPVIADVTGDGLSDIVAAADQGGTWFVCVLEGQAGGAPAAPVYSTILSGVTLAARDMTGDNAAEIVSLEPGGILTIATWDGSNLIPLSLMASLSSGGKAHIGDFDDNPSTLEILLGKYYYTQTGGSLNGEVLYSSDPGWNTMGVGVLDIDLDGRPDVLHSYEFTPGGGLGETAIHMNPVTGISMASTAVFTDWFCSGFTTADVDADGWSDLLPGFGQFVRMDGLGRWSRFAPLKTDNIGWAAGDLDGDGRDDLVSAVYDTGLSSMRLDIAASNRAAGFLPGYFITLGTASGDASPMDVNGDGLTDLVVGLPATENGFTVLTQTAAGGLLVGSVSPEISGTARLGMKLADIDGDGREEMIRLSYNATAGEFELAAFELDSGGAPALISAFTVPSTLSSRLEAGDVSGDGLTDAVFIGKSANAGVYVAAGNGLGFDAPVFYDLGVPQLDSIAIGEFTGDNLNDVAVGIAAAPSIIVVQQNSDGMLDPAGVVVLDPGTAFVADIAAADIDGDGRTDLVASSGGASVVSVFLHSGPGSLAGPLLFNAGCNASSLSCADLSGDGREDLIITDPLSDSFTVLPYDRALLLGPPAKFDAQHPGSPLPRFGIADLNGDGLCDVVIPENGMPLTVRHNRGFLATRRSALMTAAGGGSLRIHSGMPSDIPGARIDASPGDLSKDTVITIRQHADIIPPGRLRGGYAVAFGPGSVPVTTNSTFSVAVPYHPNLSPIGLMSRGLELYELDPQTGNTTCLGNSFTLDIGSCIAWLPVSKPGVYQFALDTNTLVSASFFGIGGNSGDVPLYFWLTDVESDYADVTVAWSTDGGATFRPCTRSAKDVYGGVRLMTSEFGVIAEFVWDSPADLGSGAFTVIIRIYPRDIEAGFCGDSGPIDISNP